MTAWVHAARRLVFIRLTVKPIHEFLINIYLQKYGTRVWMEQLSELWSLQYTLLI